jgi:hypothetical protein
MFPATGGMAAAVQVVSSVLRRWPTNFFDIEECRLLGCDAVWLLSEPNIRRKLVRHYQGEKNQGEKNQ